MNSIVRDSKIQKSMMGLYQQEHVPDANAIYRSGTGSEAPDRETAGTTNKIFQSRI